MAALIHHERLEPQRAVKVCNDIKTDSNDPDHAGSTWTPLNDGVEKLAHLIAAR